MKKLPFTLMLLIGLAFSLNVSAQNFKSKQKSQERVIKTTYKNGKITEREYYKLMDEQHAIKQAIAKYEADDIWTPHEKNVIHDKLVRAEKRLRKYKTNGEVY
jgi:hypothetical protein